MTTLSETDLGRAPTMREVAALAGVSLKTVSRVVNRETGVSLELASRVQHAVRMLDYRRNLTASSLRRTDQKTATIGLLLEDVSNPFSSALNRAIEDAAKLRNILVFAGSSDEDPVREREVLLAFVSHRVDGLIVVPTTQAHHSLLREQRYGGPVVFVDRPVPFVDADAVLVDNRAGAQEAVGHLVAHGHSRIAFLGDTRSIWTASERHLGYMEGLAIQGVQLDPKLVRQDIRGTEHAQWAVQELLKGSDPPTAVFTGQNLITVGAVHALQQLELQHQIALIGFDDFLVSDLLDPRVSVVAQAPTMLGQSAADLLFSRLDGDTSPPRKIVVPTQLIARGSGEIPPH